MPVCAACKDFYQSRVELCSFCFDLICTKIGSEITFNQTNVQLWRGAHERFIWWHINYSTFKVKKYILWFLLSTNTRKRPRAALCWCPDVSILSGPLVPLKMHFWKQSGHNLVLFSTASQTSPPLWILETIFTSHPTHMRCSVEYLGQEGLCMWGSLKINYNGLVCVGGGGALSPRAMELSDTEE